MKINTVSVIVSSCDKYNHAWPVFKHSFNKYWPDCPYPIYFITNELNAPIGTTIKTGEDKGWSNQMIKAINNIDSELIIFLLEDYWFTQNVDTKALSELVEFMKRNIGIEHIRLYSSKQSKQIKRESYLLDMDVLNQDESYRASLNAGIWRTNTFKELLEPNKSIWDSEHSMTEKSVEKMFLTVRDMKYIVYNIDNNMIEQGKFTDHARKYMEQECISIT